MPGATDPAPVPDRRRLPWLLVGLAGNLLLLPTMCSASIGAWRESWILQQGDECVGAWQDANDGDPRSRFEQMALISDERWHSRSEAAFLLRLPVADPGGETATVRGFWLRCEAHQGEDDTTVVDSVELQP